MAAEEDFWSAMFLITLLDLVALVLGTEKADSLEASLLQAEAG